MVTSVVHSVIPTHDKESVVQMIESLHCIVDFLDDSIHFFLFWYHVRAGISSVRCSYFSTPQPGHWPGIQVSGNKSLATLENEVPRALKL